ncbi:MAG: FHA domain-containing protein [Lentisphaerae bacterium]|nr:FHA domain-containing protein [Lentisphaerota bacterium]
MKAALIVTQDNKQVAKATVAKASFVMGRSKQADLPLEDTQVSREHALIKQAGGSFVVVDNASRNGTRLNGSRISGEATLKDGDSIGIGPFDIRFIVSEEAAPEPEPEQEADDEGATRFVADPNLSDRVKSMGAGKPKGTLDYTLSATSGAIRGTKYRNWEGVLTLGRGLDNTVVLPDDAASTHHAQILHQGQEFFVQDLNSANGTFLDGTRVQREPLKHGQKLRIGSTYFTFSVVDLAKKRKALRVALIATGSVFLITLLALLLWPKDQAVELTNRAEQLLAEGNYADARHNFEAALTLKPNDPRAAQGLDQAQRQEEIVSLIAKAQAAAESEHFDEALETCYAVFRLEPSNAAATELEEVIKAISEARLALEVRNWTDAIRLLDKASNSYPSSDLLKRLQGRARSEQGSAACMDQARVHLKQAEYQAAKGKLMSVSTNSVYHTEAAALIKRADEQMAYTAASGEARDLYRSGRQADALSAVERALRDSPGDKELSALRDRITLVAMLIERVRSGAALATSDDVPAIQGGVAICKELLDAEPDQANAYRIEAAQMADTLNGRLKAISLASASDGASKMRGGDRKGAVQAYEHAAAADPSNSAATQAAQELRKAITQESQKSYREGQAFEELGQAPRAIAAYKHILEISLPGDIYYDRATERLRRLQ